MKEFIIKSNTGNITLTSGALPNELNLDSIIGIDASNILGELLVVPVLLNKLGIIAAEATNELERKDFDLSVLEAQLADQYRKDNSEKKPTVKEIEGFVIKNSLYKERKAAVLELKKLNKVVDAAYRACMSKDNKLNRLASSIKPEEFEHELIVNSLNKALAKFAKDNFVG